MDDETRALPFYSSSRGPRAICMIYGHTLLLTVCAPLGYDTSALAQCCCVLPQPPASPLTTIPSVLLGRILAALLLIHLYALLFRLWMTVLCSAPGIPCHVLLLLPQKRNYWIVGCVTVPVMGAFLKRFLWASAIKCGVWTIITITAFIKN